MKMIKLLNTFGFADKKMFPHPCEAIVLPTGLQQLVPAARRGYQPVSPLIFQESHWQKPCGSFIDAVVQQWKTSFKRKLQGRPSFFVMCMLVPCPGMSWII
jgi:hypothetical protein